MRPGCRNRRDDQEPVARVESRLQGDVFARLNRAGLISELQLECRRADRVDRDHGVLFDLVPPGLAPGTAVGEHERPALA